MGTPSGHWARYEVFFREHGGNPEDVLKHGWNIFSNSICMHIYIYIYCVYVYGDAYVCVYVSIYMYMCVFTIDPDSFFAFGDRKCLYTWINLKVRHISEMLLGSYSHAL